MFGPDRLGHGAGMVAFVAGLGSRKADGKGPHRAFVESRHHGQHHRGIDAPRQEHAVGHIGTLVHVDGVVEHLVQLQEGIGGRPGRAVRQGRAAAAFNDTASFNGHRFPRQQSENALEGGFRTGGEL